MPRELICPHCGHAVALDVPHSIDGIQSIEVARTIETVIPGTIDDYDLPRGELGEITFTIPIHDRDRVSYVVEEDTESVAPLGLGSSEILPALRSGSSEFDPLASPVGDPNLAPFIDEHRSGSASNGSAHRLRAVIVAPTTSPAAGASSSSTVDDVEDAGPPWMFVLLASYASAVTLGLAWMIWSGQGRVETRGETMPRPARVEPSQRMASLEALPDERVTTLGKSLHVGSLEFTPLAISSGPAPLKGGGSDTLILRGRFKNVASKSVFAPLEKAFVRMPDSGASETLIETGGEPIESYPLAIASERSLRGQNFQSLKPGQSIETILVSEPGAKARLTPSMVWRIRLRVDPDDSTVVGVRFSANDVR